MPPRRFPFFRCFALVPFLLSAALTAHAGTRPRIAAQGNTLVINKRTVIKFPELPGHPAVFRAEALANRLHNLTQSGIQPHEIQARTVGKEGRIVAAGRAVLLTVSEADARAKGGTAPALAAKWTRQIREALAAPALTLSAKRLTIPLGESRTLRLGGWNDDAFATRLDGKTPPVTSISNAENRTVTLQANKVGQTTVRVQTGDAQAVCIVVVKKWAGRLPSELRAEITGSPAPADLIRLAAENALRQAPLEPGASLKILTPLAIKNSLARGDSQVVTAKVKLSGKGYLSATGIANVRVINRILPDKPAVRLFYSNTPEHLTRPRVLYAATLADDAPTRVMFHHDNQTRGGMALAVTVTNPTDSPLKLHLMPGFVPPAVDPARTGYKAGQVFLQNVMRGYGEIVTVPGKSSLPLLIQRLAPRETSSGIALLRLVDADSDTRCLLQIASVLPNNTGFSHKAQTRLDAWRVTSAKRLNAKEIAAAEQLASQNAYRAARSLDLHYKIGERWAQVPVGRNELMPPDALKDIHPEVLGDYGVLYTIRVTVQNPHPEPRKAEVVFAPGGGAALAVFNIGGKYVAVGEVRPPHEKSLHQITLRPKETRILNIQTVPLGGSSYPANVIVR
jgi:hypothetical protein